ncbi:acyl-CoA dehydrogenase family protein [Streptomyces sp. ISL-11]|uniref:acyl-CoA dehydrogenase family protein n=1 Tax=Streptomyces sp. ISL-11 TaxID=2819174 RepID=UPI001BEB9B4D|nr:acyl-CoA dehydrogenase family protein [Streptomyces sp. ISL-11]MBT2386763.1 acyl-CoA/acyl-ACP dehydrogenase [Streptomyces sp. ISL-11]
MRFLLDAEQLAFGRTLDRMLGAAGTPSAVRAWARGEHGPGLALWGRLAEAGVFGTAVPQAYGGVGTLPVELAVACVELGRHAVPGPVAETAAVGALLSRLAAGGESGPAEEWLPRVCAGQARVTLVLPDSGPYALDAEVCDGVFVVTADGGDRVTSAAGTAADRLLMATAHGPVQPSLDPARRLARPLGGAELPVPGPAVRAAAAHAADWAAFAVAAQALGVGLALLDRTVAYVRQRTQFGTVVGAFQAVKHRLADTLLGLEFARPLLHGAAVALAADAPSAPAEVAAAKAAACEAAYAAARTALQLHGAIGYTAEYDLSLWIGKARALRSAWGGPGDCRSRALDLFR